MKKSLKDTSMQNTGGRPRLSDRDRKKPRRVSVSDAALENIEAKLKGLDIKTLSELIEKIGRNQLSISSYDPLPMANVPVYRRLKSLIDEPVAVFWSVLAAAKRLAIQFELEATDDYIYTVMMRANTIEMYVGYCFPDVLVNNASALLRWLSFRIIQADSARRVQKINSVKIEPVKQEDIENYLCKIGAAFKILQKASLSPEYSALMLKTIGGLSIKQVRCVFEVQDLKVSKAEISKMVKTGLSNFRTLFYKNEIEYPFDENGWKNELGEDVWQDIHRYCELAMQKNLLDKDSQQDFERILLHTDVQASLDFWINEIDFLLGQPNEPLHKRIDNALHDHLLAKKTEIDRKLLGCLTVLEISKALEDVSNHEAGTAGLEIKGIQPLTVQKLLGKPHFYKKELSENQNI